MPFAPQHDGQRLLSQQRRFYVVQRGDTLSQIGVKLQRNWQSLARRNRIANPDLIHVGQLLEY